MNRDDYETIKTEKPPDRKDREAFGASIYNGLNKKVAITKSVIATHIGTGVHNGLDSN